MKKIHIFIIYFIVLLGKKETICAREIDWNNGQTFDWAPTIQNIDSESIDHQLIITSNFKFSESSAKVNNDSRYSFTIEHNLVEDYLSEYALYTNLPDPHFDWDDDNNNGYCEEAEASISFHYLNLKAKLSPNTDYFFTSIWINDRSENDNNRRSELYIIGQQSLYNPINSEYEAINYDLLDTINTPTVNYMK